MKNNLKNNIIENGADIIIVVDRMLYIVEGQWIYMSRERVEAKNNDE
tara:strand:- start:448 stop:588 length:141 start_codon:yes stop_codon:yes gene_type:complete